MIVLYYEERGGLADKEVIRNNRIIHKCSVDLVAQIRADQ